MTAPAATARAVDVHALPAMLTALRLPSFHRHWPVEPPRVCRRLVGLSRYAATAVFSSLA